MLILRSATRMLYQLVRGSSRTGRWWVPIVIVLLLIAQALAGATAVVVPSATYSLF